MNETPPPFNLRPREGTFDLDCSLSACFRFIYHSPPTLGSDGLGVLFRTAGRGWQERRLQEALWRVNHKEAAVEGRFERVRGVPYGGGRPEVYEIFQVEAGTEGRWSPHEAGAFD